MIHQFRTSRVVPAVAAGIAILVGIAVGIAAGPSTAATTPVVAKQVMPGMSMPPVVSPVAVSSQDASVASDAVTIQNFAFAPATVTIKAGTTLTWTNRDQDPHTVSAMSGAFHSPTLNTGQSYQYTFTTPGHFDYLCTIHPFMTATVVVTP